MENWRFYNSYTWTWPIIWIIVCGALEVTTACDLCSGKAVGDQTCSHRPRKGMIDWRTESWGVDGRYPSNKATSTSGAARLWTRTGRRNTSHSAMTVASRTIPVCTWVSYRADTGPSWHGFPQSLKANAGIIPQIRVRPVVFNLGYAKTS
jgi:hypothetical protein